MRNQNLDSTGDEGVSDAVRDEQMACRRRVFQLLACLYPANTILEAADRLNSDSEDEKAFAIEALDNLLRNQDKNLIVGIAEDLEAVFALASRSLNLEVALPKPVLEELLERRFGPASNLRVIMALENLATSGSARAVGLLEREIKSPELTIRETAARQLRHLAPERLEKFSVAPSLFYDRKSPAERVSILRKVRIFELIPGADLLKLDRVIGEQHLQSGERLFTKGEMGESLFIIVEGSARIHDGEKELAKLGPGEVVGVLAALDPEPRNASVSATADTLVFSLHRERLYALLAEHQSLIERLIHMLCQRLRAALQTAVSVDEQEQILDLPGKSEDSAAPMATDASTDLEDGLLPVEKVMLLRSAELFAELPEDALRQLAGVLVAEEYGSGDCIIEKDKFSTSLYVVFRGNTRVHDGDRTLATLGEKAVFGELAALDGEVRSASVSAIDRVSLFRLNRSDLIHVITENVEVTRGILQSLCRRLRELQAN